MKENKQQTVWFKKSLSGNSSCFILLIIFTIILSAAMMMISISMKMFIDIASGSSNQTLFNTILFSIISIITIGVCEIVTSILQTKITVNSEINMRKNFINKLFTLKPLTYSSTHTSVYMTRLTTDIQVLSELLPKQIIGSIVQEILMCILSLVLLFILCWKMAVIMVILVPLLALCMVIFSPVIEKGNKKVLQCEDQNRKIMQEILDRNILFRVYSMKDKMLQYLSSTYTKKRQESTRLGLLLGILSFLNDFMGIGLFIIAMGFGAFLAEKGEVTVGSLVAIINLVSYLYGPFIHLSGWISSISSAKASLCRIGEILNETDEIPNIEKVNIDHPEKLNLCNVSFGYSSDNDILRNINISFQSGKVIAVSGESGGGKSTLLRILMGLYLPNKGCIDLVKQNGDLIEKARLSPTDISYVPNDNGVYSGTILENIIMNSEFDKEKWSESLEKANLTHLVDQLENKSNFMVDGEGNNLSSGQLQRICIARAFYKNAPIFILDEPTSFLDSESISVVMSALKQECVNKICVIVTHNPEVINKCDEHYILKNKQLQLT